MKTTRIETLPAVNSTARVLLAGEDENFYVLSCNGREAMIFPGRADGSVIECTDIVCKATAADAFAEFLTLSEADIARRLDCY